MRFKQRRTMLNVLVNTGLSLLNSIRDRMPADLGDSVRDTYSTASDRVGRAADALRGEEDSHLLGTVTALVIGVGIGVGIGLLIAPASGEETRENISDKVADFGEKVREVAAKKPQVSTVTDRD
jgi:YtxH-like protein